MGSLGKGKKMMSASVDGRWHAYLTLRAKANELTPSKMASLVLRRWLDDSAPAVFDGERGAVVLPWDPDIKWESLVTKPTLPPPTSFPRDLPATILARRR